MRQLAGSGLAEDIPHLPPDVGTSLAWFLVAHLATAFAADPSGHQAWARKRLLGLHLVHAPSRLLAWADAVDWLIGNDLGPCSALAAARSPRPYA